MYDVQVAEGALKRLKRLPPKHRRQVWGWIKALQDDPRPQDYKKLKGIEGYRITIGGYHWALYTIDDRVRVVRAYLLFQRGEGYPS